MRLTFMSSFKLLPLKSKWVNELEILGLSDRECAIWFTPEEDQKAQLNWIDGLASILPFDVSPQWLRQSLHKPFEIFAIGPAKWSAPDEENSIETISYGLSKTNL